jgi:hypothetical protein
MTSEPVVTTYTPPVAIQPSGEENAPTAETPTPATSVAPPTSEAPETPSPAAVEHERVWNIIMSWFHSHLHGSPVSQHTPAYNHVKASLPALHAALVKET